MIINFQKCDCCGRVYRSDEEEYSRFAQLVLTDGTCLDECPKCVGKLID